MNNDGPDSPPYDGEVLAPERPAAKAVGQHNPFAQRQDDRISAGAVAIESQRATAEVQSRLVIAKRFPRSTSAAYAAAMEACKRLGLAECAIYSYNKGGKVEGPSIRLAEELARVWGNIDFGINELSRTPAGIAGAGASEMEAFAWDLETNTRSSQRFTVAHIRDKSDGGKPLTTERDIYEITANQGARRMRARILAILPPELVDDAVAQCKETIKAGGGQSWGDRVRTAVSWLSERGINAKMVADFLGHTVDDMTPDELVKLRGVMQQIKDGAKASDFFGGNGNGDKPSGSKLDLLEGATEQGPVRKYVASVEATADAAALDRFLNIPASRDAIKAMSADDRKQCEIAVQAQRRGFKPSGEAA